MSEYSAGGSPLVSLPSTTFVWKRVRMSIGFRPAGNSNERSEFRPWLRPRDPVKPLDMRLRYTGGPEASIEVRHRGRTWRFPGGTALIDVLQFVNGQTGP